MDFDIWVGRQRASEENSLQSDKAVENKQAENWQNIGWGEVGRASCAKVLREEVEDDRCGTKKRTKVLSG